MDAGAPDDAGPLAQGQGAHESSALPADPISRLEAEIERTDQTAGATPPAETERLLEETWSLFTDCLVIRDGLLEACDEIERTMGGLQRKLGTLPAGLEQDYPSGHAHPSNGALTQANGNGALTQANGSGEFARHSKANGVHPHANGESPNGHFNGSRHDGNPNGSSAG
jgi:hypothetical protein